MPAGYQFALSCPYCGSPVEQVQNVRQSPTAALLVVACGKRRCGRQYDLSLRLTALRK